LKIEKGTGKGKKKDSIVYNNKSIAGERKGQCMESSFKKHSKQEGKEDI